MRSLRIAVLDEELPYPLTSGKRIRTFNLLARLAERHRITILCHRNAEPGEAEVAIKVLQNLGIDTVMVPRAVPRKEGAGFYARLAGNLLSPLPFSVTTHTSPELVAAVAEFAAQNRVDVWHCEWTPYAQVLRRALGKRLKRVPWVVMAHNVESLIWKRYTETEENSVKRWYARRQWLKFEKFERWAFAHALWTVAVTEEDATLIRDNLNGTEQTEVVDNGVDIEFFRPQRDVERDPYKVVFVGSLDWRPNQDGVRLMIDQVFPKVHLAEPRASLTIVGRNPPDWLREAAARISGVQVFGTVADVRPFLATCGMTVVPLRVGGGSRLKILESLAMGTPVVSTQVGAEGLRLEAGRHITVTENETGLADAILETMHNPDAAIDRADEGQRFVSQEYEWGPLSEKLEEVWRVAVEMRSARPMASGG